MIQYGTDLNDISVTGTYQVNNQNRIDNNPRHYLYIPGFIVQEMMEKERKRKEQEKQKKENGERKDDEE